MQSRGHRIDGESFVDRDEKFSAAEKCLWCHFPQCMLELLVPHAVDEGVHCWRHCWRVQNPSVGCPI